MKKSYTREKRTLCGEGYMEVDLYPITPEEHKAKRREELRACGQGKSSWAGVIALAMDYYEAEDPVCRRLLQLRYLDGMPEERVVAKLHIGRTTYYHKELEALSTVAVYAAAAGLM